MTFFVHAVVWVFVGEMKKEEEEAKNTENGLCVSLDTSTSFFVFVEVICREIRCSGFGPGTVN